MRIASILLLLGAAVAGYYWWNYRTFSYRYRLTVEVETPQGVKSGSAVHEIAAHDNPLKLPDSDSAWIGFRGEAFPVELGNGKTLFVLVAPPNGGEESLIPAVQSALDPDYKGGGRGNLATVRKIARRTNSLEAELRPTNSFEGGTRSFYPILVQFRDEGDPRTVQQVDPAAVDAAFGPGYHLRRIWVRTTNDPVSSGIVGKLDWLSKGPQDGAYSSAFRNDETRPTEYRDGLGRSDFKREFRR